MCEDRLSNATLVTGTEHGIDAIHSKYSEF
jgi:hypothetical protein